MTTLCQSWGACSFGVDRRLAGIAEVGPAGSPKSMAAAMRRSDAPQLVVIGYEPVESELVIELCLELPLAHHWLASSQLGGPANPYRSYILSDPNASSTTTPPDRVLCQEMRKNCLCPRSPIRRQTSEIKIRLCNPVQG
jgi:hypothetical protein